MVRDEQATHRQEWILAILVFAALFVFGILRVNSRVTSLLDEGWLVYNARRIFEGAVLYRDLFVEYPPGLLYSLAFLYRLFGPSLLVGRLLMMIDSVVAGEVLYLISSKLVGKYFALIPPFLYVVWTPGVSPTPTWVSATLALFALLSVLLYVKKENIGFLVLSAFSAAGAVLFKQNIGMLTLLFLVTTVVLYKRAACLKALLVAASTLTVIILPVIGFFYFNGALSQMYLDLVVYPTGPYTSSNAIPPPSFLPLLNLISSPDPGGRMLYLQWATFLVLGTYILVNRARKGEFNSTLLMVFSFALLFSFVAFPRFDEPHIASTLAPTFILWAYVMAKLCSKLTSEMSRIPFRYPRIHHLVTRGSVVCLVLIIMLPTFVQGWHSFQSSYDPYVWTNPNPVTRPLFTHIVTFIADHSKPTDRILVFNGPMICFLANRSAPGIYSEFSPWDSQFQNQTIHDMMAGSVPIVVYLYGRGLGDAAYPDTFPPGYNPLFEFVISNYYVAEVLPENGYIFLKSSEHYPFEEIARGSGTPAYAGTYIAGQGYAEERVGAVESGVTLPYFMLHPRSPSGTTWWNFSLQFSADVKSLNLTYGFAMLPRDAVRTRPIRFTAYLNNMQLFSANKSYDHRLVSATQEISSYDGQEVTLSLSTDALGDASYAWAIWIITVSR